MRSLHSLIADVGVRIFGCGSIVIGLSWLCFWFTGVASGWSAEGVNTVKTNMALCQLLAGAALLLLAPSNCKPLRQRVGMIAAAVVLFIGALTLSEHLFSYNLGIDQLLASEPPGAVATASPNRMGPPGSSSLLLLGLGLLFLGFHRPRLATWLGASVCVVNLIPAVGFVYGVEEFYRNPQLTGIAWSSVIALLSIGAGLILARPAQGPIGQLLRDDAGGVLLRRLVPAVIVIPLLLGFLRVQGEQHGFYDTAAGTGALTIIIVVGFLFILWRTAAALSRIADARAKVEGEVRSLALFPEEDPFPVLRVRDDGRLLYGNRASLRVLEMWRCTVGGSVPEFVTEVIRKARQEGSGEELELRVAERDLRLSAIPVEGRDYINVYGTDLTERNRAEADLRETEARFSTLAHEAPVGIFETDPRGDCLFVNEYWQAMAGLSAAQAAGKGWSEGIHPEDRERVFAEWIAAAAAQKEFASEYRFRTPAGNVSWVQGHAKPIRDASGNVIRYIGTVLDMTERKEFQAELERIVAERTAKLQELVAELEHFSYTITHDLKSPLRAMRGFAEVVQQIGVEAQARPFLEKISTAAERMDHLIADALSYSRSVRQELPLEDVDAGALLRGMLDSYPELQPNKANIRVEGRLPVVLANEAGLTQCFSNLLGNAVKFVKAGEKPEIRVWAEVLAHGHQAHGHDGHDQHSSWVRIWVEDKGIGISKGMLPRVFEMFSRESKDYEGTGIGLALVRKVAQRMGGKVGVESEQGRGSRFWIELKEGEARTVLVQAAAPRAEAAGEWTVLYVEDEESDAMFMEQAFAARGLAGRLRLVGTGRAAIDYLSGSGEFGDRGKYPVPALVLLDLNLPQVSGFDVLEWIRNGPDYAGLPVVVFSSSARADDREKARRLGANDFVAKPSSGLKFGEVVKGLQEKWLVGGVMA